MRGCTEHFSPATSRPLLGLGLLSAAVGTLFGPASGAAIAHIAGERELSWANAAIAAFPENAKHAWRDASREPAVTIIVTTTKIGPFFPELGTSVDPANATAGPPSDAAIQHFLAIAERYGYWNATPEETPRWECTSDEGRTASTMRRRIRSLVRASWCSTCGRLAAIVAFVVVERRSADPMLPLGIFSSRQFTSANALTFVVYGALRGVFFLVAVLQVSLSYSATAAGAASLPIRR